MMPIFPPLPLLAGAAASRLVAQPGGSFWLPPPGSSTAPWVDTAFYFVLYVSAFFFLLIVTLMTFFVVRYRRRPGMGPGDSPSHSTLLEITWSGIPLVLVIIMFGLGVSGYMDMRTPPRGAYEIRVFGQKWTWSFQYPNGYVDANLHVPVDEPVKLTMSSKDVIHSLYIPAFRLKQDLVPGRYTTTWFRATEPGEYDLECAEYCGTSHSDMLAKVIVHRPGEFETWLREAEKQLKNLPPAELGRQFYLRRGCAACHSSDGTRKVGPSFKGIYGETHEFENAPPAKVDDNYIRESILTPSAKIRKGYPDQMTVYQGQLSDDQITALIEFIKSLK
jgi:cytochrome c oxidase subunit 2